MSYGFSELPDLTWERWSETADTLHMYMQMVGKTRLALTEVQNHWWNVPLYLTSRGIWTSPMQVQNDESLDISFDFVSHELIFQSSEGAKRSLPLKARTVKEFFVDYMQTLSELGVSVHLDPSPVEVSQPIRFSGDDQHRSYDREAVSRFWHALRLADFLLKRFSTTFYGKISPVHFFWGSMDLAVTRFNGKRAPARSGGDVIQQEAYSHEVISAGFWPGTGGYGQAAFYTYAAPVPESLPDATIAGPGHYDKTLGEFILNYDDVRSSSEPTSTVMRFLENAYSASADAAGWDRANLDRRDDFYKRPRQR